ncbi:T9SS type A sorting domain-containing protein [Candidatus Poribacteria bacterium]|nr:T9SS type A sorting domain-containing protein [Candidatus Poribacteria bacterium]
MFEKKRNDAGSEVAIFRRGLAQKKIIRIIFLTTFFLFFMTIVAFSNAGQKKVIEIDLRGKSETQIRQLLQIYPDLGAGAYRRGKLEAVVTTEELRKIESQGYRIKILVDDIDAYSANLRAQGYFDNFHSYEQTVAAMKTAAQKYPDLAKLYDIGDSWEKTEGIADRDIWALKISDNVTEQEDEPEVLYMGLHHAREIITPEIVLYWMDFLLSNYGRSKLMTYLVDNRQIWLVPDVNPDGHDYVFTVDSYWRKNRRDNGDGSFGVDLNRNYGYMWGYDNSGSSPVTWSETYRGTGPFSEPETQAIRDLVEEHNFVLSLSYHSYGNLFLYPWGYILENTPDHSTFVSMAEVAVSRNGYEHGNPASGAIYITNGSSDDWFYGEQITKNKVFGFTPEVGEEFQPPVSKINELILENLFPNIVIALMSGMSLPDAIATLNAAPLDSSLSLAISDIGEMEKSFTNIFAGQMPFVQPAGYENYLGFSYPNPSNPEAWIPYKLAQNAEVVIRIYNPTGQHIRTLSLGNKNAGIYITKDKAAHWDGLNDAGEKVSSGIYFYSIQAGDFKDIRRMAVIK